MSITEAIKPLPGFTFGCDPELFIMDDRGEFVSAEGLIPGTKEDPYKVACGAVQVDGMAAEFNIDPVSTFEDFYFNVKTVMASLKKMLPNGYRLIVTPAVEFSERVWEETPDKAKELGCSPDFNAWLGSVNSPPESLSNPRLRCAGGHLHTGWTDDENSLHDIQHLTNCSDLVKQMDWYLGAWSLRKDADSRRRNLYGKAGAMRFKPYGAEYRVLSNFWLQDRATMREMWNRWMLSINDMRTNFMPEKYDFSFSKQLIESINTSTRDPNLEVNFSYPIVSCSNPK